MSIEQYLRMTDDELKNLISYNNGEEYNDPFIHSVLRHGPAREEIEEELDDFTDEEIEDLLDVAPEDKIFDDDFIDRDNIEE